MDQLLTRRRLLAAGCTLPLLTLPGCAHLGGFGVEDAIRRLLFMSSERAFSRLLQDNGFFQDELARVPLPPQLAGAGAAAGALLAIPAVQQQMLQLINRAAWNAAEAAAPVVYQAVRTMSITDALSIVRGGPTAATNYLQRAMGTAIVDAMFPGVGQALRAFDNGVLNQVVQAATGINFAGLQRYVAESAATSIYRAIGREEAAIRGRSGGSNRDRSDDRPRSAGGGKSRRLRPRPCPARDAARAASAAPPRPRRPLGSAAGHRAAMARKPQLAARRPRGGGRGSLFLPLIPRP